MLLRPRIIRLIVAGILLSTTMLVGAPFAPARPRCTLKGTPGDDHLVDTAGASVICALGGNDIVERQGQETTWSWAARAAIVSTGTAGKTW